jgi:signal transduction histidine kinase
VEPSSDSISLECPQCGASIPPGQQYCPECNMDVILFTDMAFRQRLEEALAPPPATPTSTEELIPRLGDSLLSLKAITREQLDRALEIQESERREGRLPSRIGKILISMGAMTAEDLDRAIALMMAQLQLALQRANRRLETRVRERTTELSHALERLTELNQLKANFIANISHELRTPMTHLIGYLDLLMDDTFGPLNPQQKEAMETVRRATARLNGLIEDLIQFSDTSRHGISLSLQSVSTGETIQEALARLTSKAQKGNVRIEAQIPPDLPPVRADSRKITWVISQLVDNGIKFTPPGGKITIRAGESGDHVWITVEDTGIGIPASRIRELFEPFHQLDGSSTRRQGGTGMGLTLCKLIIEAHGSNITVKSKEGSGSLFMINLPKDHPKKE